MNNKIKQMLAVGILGGGVAYQTPDYANTGGTGDRTASITVSSSFTSEGSPVDWQDLVNGVDADPANMYWHNVDVTGKYIRFQFAAGNLITEAKIYDSHAYDGSYGTTTWKWQGSNNGTAWTDLCDPQSMILGGGGVPHVFDLTSNITRYTYYQLIGVANSLVGYIAPREFEFKIGA